MNTQTAREPEEVVLAAWEAMGRGDILGIVEHLADDVVWEIMGGEGVLPAGRRYDGKATVANDLLGLIPQLYQLDTIRLTREFLYTDGNAVIIEFTNQATTVRGRVNDGATYVWIFKVKDDKIIHAREYIDSRKLVELFFGED